jgi:hypothetical protein
LQGRDIRVFHHLQFRQRQPRRQIRRSALNHQIARACPVVAPLPHGHDVEGHQPRPQIMLRQVLRQNRPVAHAVLQTDNLHALRRVAGDLPGDVFGVARLDRDQHDIGIAQAGLIAREGEIIRREVAGHAAKIGQRQPVGADLGLNTRPGQQGYGMPRPGQQSADETTDRPRARDNDAGAVAHAPRHQRMTAFWACRRFSASSKITECGPSMTELVASSSRWAGRQCIKSASGFASDISASFT